MSKILILHPMTRGGDFLEDYFAGWEDVDVVSLDQGAGVIAKRVDIALGGFDSIKKAREAVRILVLGVGQTTWHFYSMLASRFSIVSPREIYEKHAM